MRKEGPPEKVVQDIRRKTRRRFSAEEKIRIVLEGLRGEEASLHCVDPYVLDDRCGRSGQHAPLRVEGRRSERFLSPVDEVARRGDDARSDVRRSESRHRHGADSPSNFAGLIFTIRSSS